MKGFPFKLVAGILIAAIIGLAVIAAGLALAIFEEETNLRATEVTWPTPTVGQRSIVTLPVSQTPTSTEMPIAPLTFTPMAPTLAPGQDTLPSPHPDVGPNSAPCTDCHQILHEGGG